MPPFGNPKLPKDGLLIWLELAIVALLNKLPDKTISITEVDSNSLERYGFNMSLKDGVYTVSLVDKEDIIRRN